MQVQQVPGQSLAWDKELSAVLEAHDTHLSRLSEFLPPYDGCASARQQCYRSMQPGHVTECTRIRSSLRIWPQH